MPTAATAPRKRRTRKASATSVKQPRKSASKVTPTPVQSEPVVINLPEGTNLKKVTRTPEPVVVNQEVKSVEKVRRNLNQLDGFELALLPLIYLEGFAKLVLKIV
tara:strand:+ start:2818 stop:3132 length:315 start_codon:yes stop_codon:yes gene_type:complete